MPVEPAHGAVAEKPRRKRFKRVWWWAVPVVGVLLSSGWLAIRAATIDHALAAAQSDVAVIRSSAGEGDLASLVKVSEQLDRDARRASNATRDPLWRAAEWLPWIGSTFHAVSTVSQALTQTSGQTILPLVRSHSLSAIEAHDKIPALVTALKSDSSVIVAAAASARQASSRVKAIDVNSVWPTLRPKVRDAQTRIVRLATEVESVAASSTALPPLLGADGPRTLLLVFQTPSEARGTGGLFGAWGELHADHGELRLAAFGSDEDLPDLTAYPKGVSPDIQNNYGDDSLLPLNANLSASFSDAAQIVAASWTAGPGHGRSPASVISIDPVALADLLGVIGSVNAGGLTLTADNAAEVLLRQQYSMFDTKNARVAFLGAVTKGVFTRLTTGNYPIDDLLGAIVKISAADRIMLWSADPMQEAAWQQIGIAGALGAPTAAKAHFGVYSVDASKLQAYLSTSVVVDNCVAGGPVLTVGLSNGVPPDPPAYMQSHVAGLNATTMRLTYALYVAPTWGLRGVTVDGERSTFSVQTEYGWRLVRATIEVPRDVTVTIVFSLSSTSRSPAPELRTVAVTPQAQPVDMRILPTSESCRMPLSG